MTAFPFGATPRLTFRQFADKLQQSGFCAVARISGDVDEALYLFQRRADNGDELEVMQYVEDETWEVMPSTFRSICARLDIDGDFLFDWPVH